MTKIRSKILCLILCLTLLTGCYIRFPGSPSAPKEYVPCSDKTVIKLLEKHKGKSSEELIDIAFDYANKLKFKESYNLWKLLTDENVYDVDVVSGAYAAMGMQYSLPKSYEKAQFYLEKALEYVDQCVYPRTVAFIKTRVGASYYEAGLRDNWQNAKEGIECLEEALEIDTQFSDTRQQVRAECLFLSAFYSECPELFNAERTSIYATGAYHADPMSSRDIVWQTAALAYLAAGDHEKAKEYVDKYSMTRPGDFDNNTLKLYYNIVKGDMTTAAELAGMLGNYTELRKEDQVSVYPVLGYYYEVMNDPVTAKKYYYDYIASEGSLTNVNKKYIVDAEKRLGMDFSEERAMLKQEIIDGRSLTLEIEGVPDEAAIALGFE